MERGFRTLFFSKPTPARKHESESRWISKTHLICKELGLVVVYGSGGSIWIWIGGGIWTRIGGGIWIRIRSGGGRWQGDDDGAATA